MNGLKTFLVMFGTIIILTTLFFLFNGRQISFIPILYIAIGIYISLALMGLHSRLKRYFDNKTYEAESEIRFQTDLRREVERKRALSQVDNENLHYQNQLRIEYIAKVAQIQLQSNQYLANMYQQAIINNSTNNEVLASQKLLELERELEKQGLI